MAKIVSPLYTALKYSHGRQEKIQMVIKKLGCVFQERDGHIVLAKKKISYPALKGKYLYHKFLFCYADLLYRLMTPAQKRLWKKYYNDTKDRFQIADRKERKKKTYFGKKRRWSYHDFALWVYLVITDMLGEFLYDYLGARLLIDELELVGGKIKVKGWIVHKDFLNVIRELYEERVKLPRG